MFAPSVCFPKMITCMGVTVTCANETPSVVLPNITVLPLSSKLNIWKCLTLLLQKDANPQDNKEKVMKTREKERIQKPQVLMLQHRNQGKSFKPGFAFRLVSLPGSLELSAASPALKLKHKCLSVQMAKASACRTKISAIQFSVSRDEGLVCFPPLNQSFTICWACWQLPSRAEGLRDTTFAPGYHDRASRITTSTSRVLSLFSKVLPERYREMKG